MDHKIVRVVVVITTYNSEDYILDAVHSILQQDFKELKLIVVDDGSTDQTNEKLQEVKDERLFIHKLPTNCGIAIARNIGTRLAGEAEYLAVMDSDDIALPHRISTQVSFLDKHPKTHILGSRIKIFHKDSSNITNEPIHPTEDSEIKSRLLLLNGSALIHPSTMIRMAFLKANHLDYPPPVRGLLGIDHDFWISAIPFGVVFNSLEDLLLLKRRHPNNVSRHSKNGGLLANLKTISRSRLLHYYYPELTGHEINHLALLLEEKRALSFEELALGYSVFKKISSIKTSSFGESKKRLQYFIQQALQQKRTIVQEVKEQK